MTQIFGGGDRTDVAKRSRYVSQRRFSPGQKNNGESSFLDPFDLPDVLTSSNQLRESFEQLASNCYYTREELFDLLQYFLKESSQLFDSGCKTCLILGSYEKTAIRNLHHTSNRINLYDHATGFVSVDMRLPDDFKPSLETLQSDSFPWTHWQLHLFCTYVDTIINVLEGRHAGPSVELGELTSFVDYRKKTYVFERDYTNLPSGCSICKSVDPEDPYSEVQQDKFNLFKQLGQHELWTMRGDLGDCVDSVLSTPKEPSPSQQSIY